MNNCGLFMSRFLSPFENLEKLFSVYRFEYQLRTPVYTKFPLELHFWMDDDDFDNDPINRLLYCFIKINFICFTVDTDRQFYHNYIDIKFRTRIGIRRDQVILEMRHASTPPNRCNHTATFGNLKSRFPFDHYTHAPAIFPVWSLPHSRQNLPQHLYVSENN